ncbi:STAS domain-containing protein [Lagierella massiliensis]|uniref:STAS domain-containing protein n=1 Tax=Lagierella massiliensis TaxID=1689303 RepID=UPI0006D7E98D|nr:STAS domain-containing protein [Lagierella massiliensis]
MGLNYDINEEKDLIKISLDGDLDAYSSDEFKEAVLKKVSSSKDILINAKKLNFIDSTGLGSLISIYNTIKEQDKNISIEEIKPNVKQIFEITELNKLFNIKE